MKHITTPFTIILGVYIFLTASWNQIYINGSEHRM